MSNHRSDDDKPGEERPEDREEHAPDAREEAEREAATGDEAQDTDADAGGTEQHPPDVPRSEPEAAPAGDGEDEATHRPGETDEPTDADADAADPDRPDAEDGSGTDAGVPAPAGAGAAGPDAGGDGNTRTGASAGPPPRGGGRVLGALALLLALAAAGAAGWLGWWVYELEQRMAELPDERAAALEPLAERSDLQALERQFQQRLDNLSEDLTAGIASDIAQEREQALASVRERLSTLEQGVDQVRELAARQQVEWRLAEIRYLLSIAQRRLQIARDTRTAVAALEAADRAIAGLGNVRLLPLRERIVDDIAAVQAVEPADIEGIALRLQNLLGRVGGLQTADSAQGDGDARQEAAAEGPWWRRITRRLEDYVSIQRRATAPEPGRPQPRAELPAADELVLALERAREAALAQNPAAYEAALQRALAVLDEGFAGGTPTSEQFRDALNELEARAVTTELPDLGSTLDLAERLSARLEAERGRTGDDGASSENGSASSQDQGTAGAESPGAGTTEDAAQGDGPDAADGGN